MDGCMHKRNRHLVEDSKYCICYLTKSCGGAAYTVDYAKRNGLTVINLTTEKRKSGLAINNDTTIETTAAKDRVTL